MSRTPHDYKKWPVEGKKNKTADEGLESGSKTTSANRVHETLNLERLQEVGQPLNLGMPGYDAGACISCFRASALVSWPMWVRGEVKPEKH
jgi:hypothetical protein